MEKITFAELRDRMFKFNEEHPDGKSTLYGVIVFTEDSFNRPYTETERTYKTTNDQKGFQHGKISNSIFAHCLDGKDYGVRLDWYMRDLNGEKDGWKVEYCYTTTEA